MSKSNEQMLQERLDQAERGLERSERLSVASRYASAIMHEVNNPLAAITNLVYLTKLQKEDADQVFENMVIIEEQLRILGNVTSQALTFHRAQPDPAEFDLVEIAESALKLHADKLLRHEVKIERQFRGPAVAKVFASEILQVVSNLILNAMDALQPGVGKISVRVKTSRLSAHITISDNGEGIPENFASRLFEPYLTSKSSGTGLGLWLSKRIIAKHRGTLRFRSSRKKDRSGTSFRISLPLSRAA